MATKYGETASINSFSKENRFLSNFHFSPVLYDGYNYLTVEHAYQAAKTIDQIERYQIQTTPKAAEAKFFGQKVTLRDDWECVKIAVMSELVLQKFAAWPKLRKKLLATGNAELIEGNHWGDTFWGVCKGKGHNNLGKILMDVRDILSDKD